MIGLERGGTAVRPPALQSLGSLLRALAPYIAALIFAAALATRLLYPSVPINVDEELWVRRGASFGRALITGELPATYQRQHPGVTNMWLVGTTLSLRYAARGALPRDDPAWHSADLPTYLAAVANQPSIPLELYVAARGLMALVTSACLAAFYLLARRLFGAPVALIAVVILLFEPFFLAYQRSLTTDANQTNFTWLALLAYLLYWKQRASGGSGRQCLLVSGSCFGLAVLSKIAALLGLPVIGLWALYRTWQRRGAGGGWRATAADLVLWSLAAAGVVFFLWPALWADLPGVLARARADLGLELDGHVQFFLGQVTEAPGPVYYPWVLLLRLSPVLLLASMLGLAGLAVPSLRRHLPGRTALPAVILDLAVVLVGLTVNASKMDRYIVPMIPGLALLAAAGVWAVLLCAAEQRAMKRGGDWRPEMTGGWLAPAIAVVLAGQLAALAPHVPYYLTYFNPLAGGSRRAEEVLMVGNGELLDQAADWLNARPDTPAAPVATFYPAALAPFYGGPVGPVLDSIPSNSGVRLAGARYVVLYVNQVQRQLAPASYFASQRPLYTVSANGIDYARIYRGPGASLADLDQVKHRVNLDFGGNARLLAYELETPTVAAGAKAVLTLFWQAEAPFNSSDYGVYVDVIDGAGNRLGGSDSRPVGNYLPVNLWTPGEVVRDAEVIDVLPGTPPGTYRLTISFYSGERQEALEVHDQDQAFGNRIALTTIQVSRPEQPTAAGPDLRISKRAEPAVTLGSSGPRLLGYGVSVAPAVRAGDAIPLTLLWQAGAQPAGDVELCLHLKSGTQDWRRQAGHPLGGNYRPAAWEAGELVRDMWEARLPADAPTGRYQLALIARSPQGETPLLDLGPVDLSARPHSFAMPQPQIEERSDWGATATLLGYDLPGNVRSGQPVYFRFYWQAGGPTEQNYVRFVHVLDAQGKIVAQQDSVPDGGALPTTSWLRGEALVDHAQLALPAGLPPGQYHLEIGLYDAVSGERLVDSTGKDALLLSHSLEIRG